MQALRGKRETSGYLGMMTLEALEKAVLIFKRGAETHSHGKCRASEIAIHCRDCWEAFRDGFESLHS